MSSTPGDVTELLEAWNRGDEGAEAELLALVYAELRALAIGHLKTERSNHTLEPAALVHEAYMRLVKQSAAGWRNRHHFFGIASRMMARVLTNYARGRSRVKRGGGWVRINFDSVAAGVEPVSFDVRSLNDALTELRTLDERKSSIVELRFFGGLTVAEIAAFIGCSSATVQRDWTVAKAWLFDKLAA